jgi:hypothetical protein
VLEGSVSSHMHARTHARTHLPRQWGCRNSITEYDDKLLVVSRGVRSTGQTKRSVELVYSHVINDFRSR